MLIADYDYDTDIRVKKQEAYEEGISQGIAQQKAEDEKLFAQVTSQKDAEIAALKAQLAEALKK